MTYANRGRTRPATGPSIRPYATGFFYVCLVLALSSAKGRSAEVQTAGEYQLKAAFLYNFAKFVDWPPKAFPSPGTPISLCVLGADPFGADLERTIKNETVGGRPFVIRRFDTVQESGGCHILFISLSEKDRLGRVLAPLRNLPVLTVSEWSDFTQTGGIINFVVEDNKIRFQINLAAAEQAGLKISSQLLKLAKIVR